VNETGSAENAALVRRFYEAFARGDATGMNACYAPDVVFSDPVFGELHGDRARAMWSMLCAGMREFTLTYEIDPTYSIVRAHAVALYRYGATGRMVRNEIRGTFACAGGAIVRHDDVFDLWKWSAQALGPAGKYLGWSPPVRGKIRTMAAQRLERYVAHAASAANRN
jgi:ketosteroid isomerase-like protein